MFSSFSASKLKPQLKMAVQRLQISSNKKSALLKQKRREIATLLAATPNPKEEEARIKTESMIREDNTIEAMEILRLSCDLLCERLNLITSQKACPADLVPTIQTLIWASSRLDIPELNAIRKQFKSKYGKQFHNDAMNNTDGILNKRVLIKLSVQPPASALVQAYLQKIAHEHGVDWKPTKAIGDEGQQPMPAPSGYSIGVAQGSGLGGSMQEGDIPLASVAYSNFTNGSHGSDSYAPPPNDIHHTPPTIYVPPPEDNASQMSEHSFPSAPSFRRGPSDGSEGGGAVIRGLPENSSIRALPPPDDLQEDIPKNPTKPPGVVSDDDQDLADLKAKFDMLKKP